MNTNIYFWLKDFCQKESGKASILLEELQKQSFLNKTDQYQSAYFGILTFDHEDLIPSICSYIKEIKKDSTTPLIVTAFLKRNLISYEYWKLLRAGACDVMTYQEVSKQLSKILSKINRWQTVDKIMQSGKVKSFLVGESELWLNLLRQVIEVACYTKDTVLIQGESGTGKELVARLIHLLSNNGLNKELTLLDCTTVVPELSGSEFFGHEKGAFTNAIAKKEGAFELANNGVLFLDEIGELPINLQAELLRVIQEGVFKRVGSNVWQKTDFRLLCATNRDLEEEVIKENFRQDLYYRISTFVFTLPPLRDRKSDIPHLVQHFLKECMGTAQIPEIDVSVIRYLMSKDFPGNVRELKQLVRRITCRYTGEGSITIGDIPFEDLPTFHSDISWEGIEWKGSIQKAINNGVGLKEIKRKAGEMAINLVIEDEAGNLQQAARRLGVSDRTLQIHTASLKDQDNRKQRTNFSH